MSDAFLKVHMIGGYPPMRATDGAAGWDLHATEDMHLQPTWQLMPIGIRVQIPSGWVGLIKPRSGLARRLGVDVFEGTIDSDYRGQVGVLLRQTNAPDGQAGYYVQRGERIAQLVVVPCLATELRYIDKLEDTDRGAGGFGSTGT